MPRWTPRRLARLLALTAVVAVVLTAMPRTAHAVSFTNPTPLTIPDAGPASLYPSPIMAAGVAAPISSVSVTLHGLSHTFAYDLDILLVSPAGTKFILLSRVCGHRDFTNATITLDDTAPSGIAPAGGACPGGTFRPTSTIGSADLDAPAPVGPYHIPAPAGVATLAVFNGETANGTWNLYILDNDAADNGSLSGGWTLTINQDRTAPELRISVDPTTKDALVEGVDNPGGSGLVSTNPITPTSCAPVRTGTQQCLYRAADNDGNSVTATLVITKQSGQTQIVVQRLQYSGKPATTPLSNSLVASFAPPSGAPTQFNQTAQVIEPGTPATNRKVTANWTAAAGTTTVTQVTPSGPTTTCPAPGPDLLALLTQAGALRIPPVC